MRREMVGCPCFSACESQIPLRAKCPVQPCAAVILVCARTSHSPPHQDMTRLVTGSQWKKRQGDGKRDQYDDDPLKHLHPSCAGSIRHLAIDAVQRLEFAQDARVPGLQMKAVRDQPRDTG